LLGKRFGNWDTLGLSPPLEKGKKTHTNLLFEKNRGRGV